MKASAAVPRFINSSQSEYIYEFDPLASEQILSSYPCLCGAVVELPESAFQSVCKTCDGTNAFASACENCKMPHIMRKGLLRCPCCLTEYSSGAIECVSLRMWNLLLREPAWNVETFTLQCAKCEETMNFTGEARFLRCTRCGAGKDFRICKICVTRAPQIGIGQPCPNNCGGTVVAGTYREWIEAETETEFTFLDGLSLRSSVNLFIPQGSNLTLAIGPTILRIHDLDHSENFEIPRRDLTALIFSSESEEVEIPQNPAVTALGVVGEMASVFSGDMQSANWWRLSKIDRSLNRPKATIHHSFLEIAWIEGSCTIELCRYPQTQVMQMLKPLQSEINERSRSSSKTAGAIRSHHDQSTWSAGTPDQELESRSARLSGASDSTTLPRSVSEELERLSNLRESGAITEEEFAAAKRKVLES